MSSTTQPKAKNVRIHPDFFWEFGQDALIGGQDARPPFSLRRLRLDAFQKFLLAGALIRGYRWQNEKGGRRVLSRPYRAHVFETQFPSALRWATICRAVGASAGGKRISSLKSIADEVVVGTAGGPVGGCKSALKSSPHMECSGVTSVIYQERPVEPTKV